MINLCISVSLASFVPFISILLSLFVCFFLQRAGNIARHTKKVFVSSFFVASNFHKVLNSWHIFAFWIGETFCWASHAVLASFKFILNQWAVLASNPIAFGFPLLLIQCKIEILAKIEWNPFWKLFILQEDYSWGKLLMRSDRNSLKIDEKHFCRRTEIGK